MTFKAARTPTVSPRRLSRLRAVCLALPEAVETETWGEPNWRVRNRIFAIVGGQYPGGRPSLSFKAAEGMQAVLVEAEPERFFVPPYVGSKGWVAARLDSARVDWPGLAALIRQSYRLVAPKRLATEV